jgi:plastocyanin
MKKILLLALASLFISISHATKDTIMIQDFKFSIPTLNATVGDTVVWIWTGPTVHTTTSINDSIPAGAAPWDSDFMDATNKIFTYKLTTAGTYKYLCTVHPFMKGTLVVSEILPVTLTAFKVVAAGTNASILWLTANEQNIDYYNIKRSSDGINFTSVGQVKAVNKTSSNTYSFTDKNIPARDKYMYYYIEVVDKDGSHTSSAIQSFKNVLAKASLLRQVFPNPVRGTDHLMLQFYADSPGKMDVKLFDASGALIKQVQMNADEGINNSHFHTGALAAGTYVLQCTLDGKKETRQIIVQ